MAGGFGALAAAVGKAAGQQLNRPAPPPPASVGAVVGHQLAPAPVSIGGAVGQQLATPPQATGNVVGLGLAPHPGSNQPLAQQQAQPQGPLDRLVAAIVSQVLSSSLGRSSGAVAGALLNDSPFEIAPEAYGKIIGPDDASHGYLPVDPLEPPAQTFHPAKPGAQLGPVTVPPVPPPDNQGPQGGWMLPPSGPDRVTPYAHGVPLPLAHQPSLSELLAGAVANKGLKLAHTLDENTGKFGRYGYLKYD